MVKPIVAKRTLPVKKRFSISEPVEQTETLLSTHNTYRAGDDASHLKAANSLDGDKYSFEALVSKSPVEIVPVAVRDIPTKGKKLRTGEIANDARANAGTLYNTEKGVQKYIY